MSESSGKSRAMFHRVLLVFAVRAHYSTIVGVTASGCDGFAL